jgi:nicotinamidase-related amidase
MTVSTLDPVTALIVVDLQSGTVRNPTVHPIEGVVASAAAVLAAFRSRGLPVVIARVDGTPAGRNSYGGGASAWPAEMTELVPEITVTAEDVSLTRRAWSVFSGTELHEQLAALAVTEVVLVGLATSFGIESSARDAYDLGYSVVVVTDAVSDMRAEAHENSVARIFPILGDTATSAEIVALLG